VGRDAKERWGRKRRRGEFIEKFETPPYGVLLSLFPPLRPYTRPILLEGST